MANKYYVSGEQRAGRVNDLFSAIAPRYDLINDLQSFGLHRLWKRKLVQLARVRPGEKALDLCCGTGDVSFALADRGAESVGLDFSAPMLEVARRRLEACKETKRSDNNKPAFLRGDAQDIPFPDGRFDVVTISYGLRNLSSLERGLEEMRRVVKQGGRILVLDFGLPDNRVWRAIYLLYLSRIVPLFGRFFCGDPATHAYILESLKHYPAQRGVAERMRKMGCANVRIHNLLGGIMSVNYGEKGD